MPEARAPRISRIGLTVADLAGTARFYEEALGFRRLGAETLTSEQVRERFGVEGSHAEVATLQLGAQAIELVAFERPGEPYPQPRAANDPWFHHFAIAVNDMQAAYARLSGRGGSEISTGGPQRLPPSTGSVTAYKFRDPEGHPLELSLIPGSAWTDPARRGEGPCLGVDHTAIAVSDLRSSLGFYVGVLGFSEEARLLNTGPEQDRLDGLPAATLDISVLKPACRDGPHVELLAYRSPRSTAGPRAWSPRDVAAVRMVLEVAEMDATAAQLRGTGAASLTPTLWRDPDGHLLELTPRQS